MTNKKIYSTSVENKLPEEIKIGLRKIEDLRYGENPNQGAAIYNGESFGEFLLANDKFSRFLDVVKSGKQGLSATNYMDIAGAANILRFFDKNEKSAVSVMKHINPCGFAITTENRTLDETFKLAWDSDKRSAFGSVVVVNDTIDKATAEAMDKKFIEVVAANDFEEGVMNYFNKKENRRVVKLNNIVSKINAFSDEIAEVKPYRNIKALGMNKFIVQEPYLSKIRSANDLDLQPSSIKDKINYKVMRKPSGDELKDLFTAWYINIGVRSNSLVFVKDGVLVSAGTGEQERVGAAEQAVVKGYQKAMLNENLEYDGLMGIQGKDRLKTDPFKGAVCASDAFFPFPDSIELLNRVGVTAVIQPGGSANDYKVIDAVNQYNMAMAFTGERCFSHH